MPADSGVVFPRRTVTRASSAAETNEAITREEFERTAAQGAFALAWDAHGRKYGIPRVDR